MASVTWGSTDQAPGACRCTDAAANAGLVGGGETAPALQKAVTEALGEAGVSLHCPVPGSVELLHSLVIGTEAVEQ